LAIPPISRPQPSPCKPPITYQREANGQEGLIAIEWWPDDFAAIAYATSKEILVVEAPGKWLGKYGRSTFERVGQGFQRIGKTLSPRMVPTQGRS
jgi:hypothetical protein